MLYLLYILYLQSKQTAPAESQNRHMPRTLKKKFERRNMPETQAQKRKELTPLPEFIQVSYLIINCHYSPTSIATEIVLSTFV